MIGSGSAWNSSANGSRNGASSRARMVTIVGAGPKPFQTRQRGATRHNRAVRAMRWRSEPGLGTARRLRTGLLALLIIVICGTAGFIGLGYSFIDALFQTV